jgi:acetyl-CoA C-acetyltransferase
VDFTNVRLTLNTSSIAAKFLRIMSMRSAVIVSTARTPIGRAYRGAFNNTASPTLSAMSIRAAVERAGIDPAEVDDLCWGAALQQGSQATLRARRCSARACP